MLHLNEKLVIENKSNMEFYSGNLELLLVFNLYCFSSCYSGCPFWMVGLLLVKVLYC